MTRKAYHTSRWPEGITWMVAPPTRTARLERDTLLLLVLALVATAFALWLLATGGRS